MVSVIIPTYGGAAGIKKVIESILVQTYKNIEIIVVDDNGKGTDNQRKTIKRLKKYIDEKSIIYIIHEKNLGGSSARNTGAKVSKGDYLMFLDDDDTVSNDKIENQVKALQDVGCKYGIAYCSTRVFYDNKLSNIIKVKKNGDILYDYLLGKVYMGTGTALMVRDAWESLGGYNESFVRHQDWEFFARVLDKYDAIAVDNVYFNRYITNRNLPQNIDLTEKYADHYIEFLKRYPFHIPNRQIRKVINMNNSRIALCCIREKQYKRFFKVMSKYDNIVQAYSSFVRFMLLVCFQKLIGRKS
ncbi:glycosyltransferase family 2 protein [Lactonifactor longoviformis]|uniref:Glycosyl transferase family 2 n=1 Tax=Lactonifactor longoviformis DSM 17459 TaxID=1122155 RepID=A0A1M4YNV2_9CLOT|nr:glycosyltransferase family 2 protein [Lactonifactor longoviformis]POP30351.1 glycosyltransferase family 2 protein [Lactonifactor longoviformis]SHF07182.1 Glycosyl transferase family 2 [Lactonifactor longoviformis DSM 17459]